MGDSRRYVAAALATVATVAASVTALAGVAGAQTAGSANPADPANPPVISTTAGTGTAGCSTSGTATSAQLNQPTGVAEDLTGNIYVADTSCNRVLEVTTAGQLTTIAGNGSFGFGGDGGQAKNAQLAAPTGVAVDGAGNVFIADTDNNRVRRVDASTGQISTYAGTGRCNPDGDNLMATNFGLCLPTGVALDRSNDLFIADSGNNDVREVTPNGMITRFAGTGAVGSSGDGGPAKKAKFNTPTDVAVDNQVTHNLYIADTGNSKIRAVNTAGIISTFAGKGTFGWSGDGGKAPLAELASPTGVGIDPLGNVYIADTQNNRIRVVIPLGDIFTYAGTGATPFNGDGIPAVQANLDHPTGAVAAVDGQNVYFSDTNHQRVRRIVGGPPPNIPESPLTVALLPLSALLLLTGGGFLVLRRRRRAGAATA
jgi:sugar lactone lactonase YvrE